ncbi:phage integrase N-terminal SAM-like domain-containing protein [Bisbaumannia pacifica]|nr:phage integrase N-terminal SAM-like domain-containing protein [Halomonas pacifica]
MAAATQNQALNALVFLYRQVLEQPLGISVSSPGPSGLAGCLSYCPTMK